jgi:nucleoside-diphosphate-sugar epimerase
MEFPADAAAAGGMKYQASKLLAHRATLDWVASHKPRFHVITLHPTIVYGHSIIQDSAESVDPMNALLWASLFSEKPMMPSASVDVEDVAVAHLNALELELDDKPEVHEFLLDGDGWSFERVVGFVREKYSDLGIKMTGPFVEGWTVDTKKAEEVLGIKWRSVEDTISSFLDQQLQYRS